jgi:cytochrome bd-type quinol oxidase subunit 1
MLAQQKWIVDNIHYTKTGSNGLPPENERLNTIIIVMASIVFCSIVAYVIFRIRKKGRENSNYSR